MGAGVARVIREGLFKEVAFESPEKSVGFFRVSCRLLLLYIFGCDYRVSVEIEAMKDHERKLVFRSDSV